VHSEQRHFSYYTGSRWINVSIAILLIAVISLWLADSLRETEERTEKLLVELAVRRMNMGMQLAMGEAMMDGREREIPSWVDSNPARWLDGDLKGYVGECPRASDLEKGAWCFDALRGELHYRPRLDRNLRLKNGGEVSLLKWRVVAKNTTAQGGLVGLRVENITLYEWFAE